MESFLDEYQYVRLGMTLLGAVLLGVVTLISGWTWTFAVVLLVLGAVLAHAGWSLTRGVRSPIAMLLLDLTLWGAVMALNYQNPVVNPGTFAFLSILPVMFANSFWVVSGLFSYLAAWYGLSYFMGAGLNARTIGLFMSVLVTVAVLDAVLVRIRIWLGRLEANRSQMLGTVSHELKNNLTAMLGMTELVTTGDDIGSDEAMELIGLAHQQAVDAAEIVEDLLTVSRLQQSALSLDPEPVDLRHEVATTVHRFDGEGTVVSITGDELPTVVADSLRVRQILRNLVSNAVRYGGSHIEVATSVSGDRAQVVVRDDGDGIPDDELNTIFLPYRRSAKTPRTGTSVGLGLYVSHHLAHAMGGSLTYRRSEGWTEFLLSLPARPDLPLPRPEPVPEAGSVCV